MERWYTLYTQRRKETLVRDLFESRGIRTYLPMYEAPGKGRAGRRREEPLFARYLFAHLDLDTVALSSVRWAQGVTTVVSFGGRPAVVDDSVIRWLQNRLDHMSTHGYHKGLPLRANDRLRITGGPLAGMEAVFDRRLSSEDRARVFIRLLDRLTACEIDLAYLERV